MTTTELHVSASALFAPSVAIPELQALLLKCMEGRASLRVTFGADGAQFAVGGTAGAIRLGGRWRSPGLEGRPVTPGALLLAPLLMHVQEIELPTSALVTLGSESRSPADLCMRNYFHAACRGERVVFAATSQPSKGDTRFAQHYRWLLKAHFADEALILPDGPHLLLVAAHLPVELLHSPLLVEGLNEWRAIVARHATLGVAPRQRGHFLDLRSRLATHWPA